MEISEGKSVQEMVDEALRQVPNANGLFSQPANCLCLSVCIPIRFVACKTNWGIFLEQGTRILIRYVDIWNPKLDSLVCYAQSGH